IGWRSVEGSKVDNAGSVHFKPAAGGRGTEVKVVLRYDPPGGVFGAAVSKMFGEDPDYQVQEDLRRLKMLVETGEIATIAEQPTGRYS
ncbi:MAG TPA: cyclase, partial [Thermoanaerobaculia bacterium]